jgi:hypothetical protein
VAGGDRVVNVDEVPGDDPVELAPVHASA